MTTSNESNASNLNILKAVGKELTKKERIKMLGTLMGLDSITKGANQNRELAKQLALNESPKGPCDNQERKQMPDPDDTTYNLGDVNSENHYHGKPSQQKSNLLPAAALLAASIGFGLPAMGWLMQSKPVTKAAGAALGILGGEPVTGETNGN